jgi:ABC-type glycerol-3-phosphate transport system substrate-binding protein
MTLALLLLLPAIALAASKTITLWYPGGDITAGVNDFVDPKLWAEFEAKNDVKVQAVALDYETMKQKMLAAAAARNIADILFVDDTFVSGFAKEGLLDPMEPAKAKAWLAAVMPEIKLRSDYGNGQMWGYPQYGGDTYALTWNKDHFKEAGLDPERPPKTWAEFRDYAKKLTKRDAQGNIIRVGFAIRHLGTASGIVHKHYWALAGAGAQLVVPPDSIRGGKSAFNNEGGKAALQIILDMLDVDKSTSLSFPDARTAFLKGIASMQYSELVSIKARQPKEAPNLKWGFGPPPVRKAGDVPVALFGGFTFLVPKDAKNKDMAWKALEWLNSPEEDYELCKKNEATPRYRANWGKEPFKSSPYFVTLRALYPGAVVFPINLGSDGVVEALGAAIQKAWHHEASVDAALAEAERLANTAISEAAK